ncbi:DUF4349 domain-containing protein [Demequina flava]|uniref:DUF4349 domain-containing protein n=1 Tax=Demequina flava TaxID=1095025 RepID=UPI0007816F28|nr:DUF4349 domain-containing protein [Demequina flava]
MNTFSPALTVQRPAQGRARLFAAVVAIFALGWLLAGCSSSDASDSAGEADYGGREEAAYDQAIDSEEAIAYEDGDAATTSGEAPAPTADRSVIITGSVYMTVDDPVAAADQAASIVNGAGGRIDARSETAPTEYDGGSAWLTLRIPSDRLDAVVEDLRELGTVDEFNTSSQDVTREVTDLDAQISTLQASTERIEGLLDQAEDMEDIIALENELDRRRAELESLEARQRALDDQVSMSTIDLSLTTEPVVIVDDEPTNFLSGLETGWNALTGFLSGVLVATGVVLPWLAVGAVIALVVIAVVRSRRSQRTAPASAQEPAADETAQAPQSRD